jgi:hypothetical protein
MREHFPPVATTSWGTLKRKTVINLAYTTQKTEDMTNGE